VTVRNIHEYYYIPTDVKNHSFYIYLRALFRIYTLIVLAAKRKKRKETR